MAYPFSEKRFRFPCMALNNHVNSPLWIIHPGSQATFCPLCSAAKWTLCPVLLKHLFHFFHRLAFLVYFGQHTLWATEESVHSGFIWALQKPSTLAPNTRCAWPCRALAVLLWNIKNVMAAGSEREIPTQVPPLIKRKNYFGLPPACSRQLWSNELLFQDLSSDLLLWQVRAYQPHPFCGKTDLVKAARLSSRCRLLQGRYIRRVSVAEPRKMGCCIRANAISSFKIEKTYN